MRRISVILLVSLLLGATALAQSVNRIRYEGSSTVGKFIADSSAQYGKALFNVSTLSESAGGEECLIARRCDLGGVAREIDPQFAGRGLVATLIGHDVIAAIVAADNPVGAISMDQLRGIFSGRIRNWSELGGPDLAIKTYVTNPRSATHHVFRRAVLGEGPYEGTTTVRFDARMIQQVAGERGAIGQISVSFLSGISAVTAIAIDAQRPSLRNPDYPIARPLYLVTAGAPSGVVRDYIEWVLGEEGQSILRRRFRGARAAGATR